MTNRYHSLLVALEQDTREDDAEHLIAAIEQLRGVAGVTGKVNDGSLFIIRQRLKGELLAKIIDLFRD